MASLRRLTIQARLLVAPVAVVALVEMVAALDGAGTATAGVKTAIMEKAHIKIMVTGAKNGMYFLMQQRGKDLDAVVAADGVMMTENLIRAPFVTKLVGR